MLRFIAMFLMVFSMSFVVANEALAKRFGGGKSFGMQRSVTSQKTSSFNQSANHQSMPSAASSSTSRLSKWAPALAGLAAGGLLSYLLMGHGVGASLFSWLAIAAVGFFILQFFRQRKLQAASATQANVKPFSLFESTAAQSSAQPVSAPFAAATGHVDMIPGFDQEGFLRDAKSKFIRLQVAYDQKNITDIREFTTPDVCAEIQLQLSERGAAENYTDVVELRAELLEAVNEFQVPVASVRFSGLLKEAKEAVPVSFEEVWHFRGDANHCWRVAGIQQ